MFRLCKTYFYLFMFFALVMFFTSLYFLYTGLSVLLEFNILSYNSISIVVSFYFDYITLLFMSFVFYISSLITMYSEEYMHGDKTLKRFLFLMFLFVLSMMLMICSLNLVMILLGWDGLGLVSYLLVVYYQNAKAYNAGMLTALSNRVGDAALLMSIALMCDVGSWSFTQYLEQMKSSGMFTLFTILIILAAITKSAQIPFSSWLPAAMAAPTPVSSLVHSSTLVTAGVYLLIRFSPLFTDKLMNVLLFLSLFTMFMAGMAANFEYDLKKIIALSTLSQLGMMITLLALGNSELAFFHLLAHAMFKALLFMCAGNIIHSSNNCQDIRYMGSVIEFLPVTSVFFSISNMALCGIPFLTGFYSKDLMAEIMSMKVLSIFTYLIFFISIGLTVAYSVRLSFYLFFTDFFSNSTNSMSDDNGQVMMKSMMFLIFFVSFKGSVLMWLLFSSAYSIILPFYMKIITLLMIMSGAFLGYEFALLSYNYSHKSLDLKFLSSFLASMWNMPVLSTLGLGSKFLKLGKTYLNKFDFGWLEYYGSKNVFMLLKKLTKNLQLFSKNHLKLFLLIFIIFVLFMYLINF